MTQDIRHFAEELEEVKRRLLVMAILAEERVSIAMRALVERDRTRLAGSSAVIRRSITCTSRLTTAVSSFLRCINQWRSTSG